MARDERVTSELEDLGWLVIRVWESDILENLEDVVDQIAEAVDSRR